MERPRGQSIVEFALVLPLLMLVLLAFAELAIAVAHRAAYQNGVDVMAQWAAEEMQAGTWPQGWQQVIMEEMDRTGCQDRQPELAYPDGAAQPGDRLLVSWTCPYVPTLTADLFDFDFVVESEAVIPGAKPSP